MRFLRRFPGNRKGLTILELAVASLIMAVIMAALVMLLHTGEVATGIGSSKTDLEAEVKLLTAWIAKDVRQAKIQELNENDPTTDHIKYNLWVWDNATYSQQETDEYVEYEYDSASNVLTRRYIIDDEIEGEINITNVTMSPFYTSYTNESVNDFNNGTLLSSRRLIVAVKKEKVVRGQTINMTMIEEIRIRNE